MRLLTGHPQFLQPQGHPGSNRLPRVLAEATETVSPRHCLPHTERHLPVDCKMTFKEHATYAVCILRTSRCFLNYSPCSWGYEHFSFLKGTDSPFWELLTEMRGGGHEQKAPEAPRSWLSRRHPGKGLRDARAGQASSQPRLAARGQVLQSAA